MEQRSLSSPSGQSSINRMSHLTAPDFSSSRASQFESTRPSVSQAESWQGSHNSSSSPHLNTPSNIIRSNLSQPTTVPNWPQEMPRPLPQQEQPSQSVHHLSPPSQAHPAQSGFSYMADTPTSPQPHYGSPGQAPLTYDQTQHNYGQSKYPARPMATTMNQTGTEGYYQDHPGYITESSQQTQGPPHIVYNMSRPG